MNSKLIKASVAMVALLVTSFAAEAADMPVKAQPFFKGAPRSVMSYYNWGGLYAGLNFGYGFGKSSWDLPAVETDPKGMMVGLTAGYNWQVGSFVYGVEGDYDWSMMKGTVTCGAADCETKNKWLGTARARLGYAFDRYLPYLTGGAAFGNIEATNNNVGGGSASKTNIGWTAGAGIEYAFLGNWTAKVEYLYVDLGKFDCGVACSAVVPDNVSFTSNIVRGGLNYKFSGPIMSRF